MLKLNCKTTFKFKNDDSSQRMVFAGLTKDSEIQVGLQRCKRKQCKHGLWITFPSLKIPSASPVLSQKRLRHLRMPLCSVALDFRCWFQKLSIFFCYAEVFIQTPGGGGHICKEAKCYSRLDSLLGMESFLLFWKVMMTEKFFLQSMFENVVI